MPDAPDNIKALAARLSQAHGIHKAILVHGLVALEPCVKRRLNRTITKPLDLACLRAFKAEMEGQAVAPDVQAALDALPAGIKEKVVVLLDSLHLCGGYFRIGVGSAGLYKHFEEGERVHEIAYDAYGMRMFDCAGMPLPVDAGLRQSLRARGDRRTARRQRPVRLRDGGPPGPVPDGPAPGNVRKSLEAHEADMMPMMREGQPLIDVYAPLCCVRFSEKFEPDEIAFDEVWKECEALYREGKVRARRVATSARRSSNASSNSVKSVPRSMRPRRISSTTSKPSYDLCRQRKNRLPCAHAAGSRVGAGPAIARTRHVARTIRSGNQLRRVDGVARYPRRLCGSISTVACLCSRVLRS